MAGTLMLSLTGWAIRVRTMAAAVIAPMMQTTMRKSFQRKGSAGRA
jgi:hypothetical protein